MNNIAIRYFYTQFISCHARTKKQNKIIIDIKCNKTLNNFKTQQKIEPTMITDLRCSQTYDAHIYTMLTDPRWSQTQDAHRPTMLTDSRGSHTHDAHKSTLFGRLQPDAHYVMSLTYGFEQNLEMSSNHI